MSFVIPRTCEYVTLHSKKDFAAVIKDLEIGGVFFIIQEGPILIRERGRQGQKRCEDRNRGLSSCTAKT